MPEEYFAINHSMSRRTPSTMDSAGILSEVVALNGAKGTITLGTGTWRIDLETTIPANARLVVEQGAMLTNSGSGTLAINGPFDAPMAQVFSGFSAGDVTFGSVTEVYPEWWGASVGASNNASALNAALAAPVEGSTVYFSALYPTTETVASVGKALRLIGTSFPFTRQVAAFGAAAWDVDGVYKGAGIKSTLTSGNILSISDNSGGAIENLVLAGPGSGASVGLRLDGCHVSMANLLFSNSYTGLKTTETYNSVISIPKFRGCAVGVDLGGNANVMLGTEVSLCDTGITMTGGEGNRFIGGAIQGCVNYGIDSDGAEDCMVDSVYFENTAASAAIRITSGDNWDIRLCHQGWSGHDIFDLSGNGHTVHLAKYAQAVLIKGANTRVYCRTSKPSGSAITSTGSYFEIIGDDGVIQEGPPAAYAATLHSNTLSGSKWAFLRLLTVGGLAYHIDARDDVGCLRIMDEVNNKAFVMMEANGENPRIAFLGATPVVRQEVTGSAGGNAALTSLLSALEALGLITDSST